MTLVNSFSSSLILLVAVLVLPSTPAIAASGDAVLPDNPHVVMIYTDDMGYADISSFAQNPLPVATPNIDRLADEGMKFTQFYVSMPICSPSRAAVLSGMFSPATRLTNYLQERAGNNSSDQNDYMDPELSYLPRSFQAAGYATAHVGKWHLGGGRDIDNAPSIGEYGYDEFYSTWESPNPDPVLGIQYTPWSTNLEPGQIDRHRRTEYMVDKTLNFMRRHANQPCFVTLWADDLHTPFRPSPEMMTKYGGVSGQDNSRANFYGVLEEYDRQIGRLLDGLASEGMEENTIVFFTGDNGPAPDYGVERTDGMRGRKLSLYEGGVRQPFVIRWPGHIPADQENSTTVLSTVDLLPTLATLTGIALPPEALAQADGEDLSQAMLGTPIERTKPLLWEYGRTGSVPRPGVNSPDRSPRLAIREGDYKLLVNLDDTDRELYNVRVDPNETTNLASQEPVLVTDLSARVRAWANALPHRTHSYPVFSPVDVNSAVASEFVSAAQLQAAAGATSTARIDGVAVDANGNGDVYAIHVDEAHNESFLIIDPTTNEIQKLTDSSHVAQQLGAPAGYDLGLVAGFDYAAGGHRLFFGEESLGLNGQRLIIEVDASTGAARLVLRSSDLQGMNDFSVRPDATIAAVRGADGNKTIGTVSTSTGNWTQKVTESQLLAQTPGATTLPPVAVGANSSNGEVFVFADGDRELFSIPNIAAGTPSVVRLTQPTLSNSILSDVAVDQAGNIFGVDLDAAQIVAVRAGDGAVSTVTFAEIRSQLGGAAPFTPVAWRGAAARMGRTAQADLFLASSTGDYGIVRLRFGAAPTAVNDWNLY